MDPASTPSPPNPGGCGSGAGRGFEQFQSEHRRLRGHRAGQWLLEPNLFPFPPVFPQLVQGKELWSPETPAVPALHFLLHEPAARAPGAALWGTEGLRDVG